MILKIVKYPEPVLQQPGEPVTEFDERVAQAGGRHVRDHVRLAGHRAGRAAGGRIKARHCHRPEPWAKTPRRSSCSINPEIISSEGKQYEEEGCLSFPDIREKVVRAAKVRIRAQDEHGKWFEMDGEELLSRCFQHEIDHLDGVLFIFRMSALKRNLNLRKIRKMQSEGTW